MSALSSPRTRRAAGLAGLLGAAVLLVAGKAATAPPTHPVVLAGPAPAHPKGAPRPAPSSAGTPRPAAPVTVLGQPEDAMYGTVQVKVTLSGGRITDVQAVQLPSGGRSSDIAAYAAPQLRTEVLAAQSARIDTVSGASYTSEAYARSVQSALDSAPR
jgi:uncharacterized protein with FMN-binding domain